MFVDTKLTQRKYQLIRKRSRNSFPSYKVILAAKKRCYPDKLTINETDCTVELQALLDHTTKRLLDCCKENIANLPSKTKSYNLNMIFKWGCDGSSGFNEFKQKFMCGDNSDASIFLTTVLPLRLLFVKEIIWDNAAPSSTRYCRPIRLQITKETSDVIQNEYNRVSKEILNLVPLIVECEGYTLVIKYELHMTMADGKVINTITNTTSTLRCYLCGATSSSFNDLKKMKKTVVKEQYLKFGISSLHASIRFFECILHIAYRLPFKRWCKTANEDIFESTKRRIQKQFFERLGLHVDKPRANSGTSNDGNTARRFFQNATISAEITGVDVKLIERLRIILIAISCGEEIDPEKFKVYANETAELYTRLYKWYHMPTTMHKILIHGHVIIKQSVLPIGKMCEEAQEALNKDIRRIRSNNSRKISRTATNIDILNALFVASDPKISSHREKEKVKVRSDIPNSVYEMLKERESYDTETEDEL